MIQKLKIKPKKIQKKNLKKNENHLDEKIEEKKKKTKLIQKNYSLIEKKIENKSDIKNLEKELEEK